MLFPFLIGREFCQALVFAHDSLKGDKEVELRPRRCKGETLRRELACQVVMEAVAEGGHVASPTQELNCCLSSPHRISTAGCGTRQRSCRRSTNESVPRPCGRTCCKMHAGQRDIACREVMRRADAVGQCVKCPATILLHPEVRDQREKLCVVPRALWWMRAEKHQLRV